MLTPPLYSRYDEQPPSPKGVLLTMYEFAHEEKNQRGLPLHSAHVAEMDMTERASEFQRQMKSPNENEESKKRH